MQIKRYYGKTFSEIMARVEKEHGKDAVVLHVNKMREPGLKGFFKRPIIEALVSCETAGPEPESRHRPLSLPSPDMDRTPPPKEEPGQNVLNERLAFLEKMMDQMALIAKSGPGKDLASMPDPDDVLAVFLRRRFDAQGISGNKTRKLCSILKKRGTKPKDVFLTLEKIFLHFFKNSRPLLDELPNQGPCRVVFTGLPGAGKTTSMAKLSFHLKLRQGIPVAMVNCDSQKISAGNEIKKYGEFSRIDTYSIFSPSEIPSICSRLSNMKVICFDTSAADTWDPAQMDNLKQFINAIQPHLTILVLDAGSSYALARQTASAFVGFPNLVFLFTKLDQTRAVGTLVNVKTDHKTISAFGTSGRDVLGDIQPVNARWVVRRLLDSDDSKDLQINNPVKLSKKSSPKPVKDPAVVPFPGPLKSNPVFPQSKEAFVQAFFRVLEEVDEKAATQLKSFFGNTARLGLILFPDENGLALKSPDGRNEFALFTRNALVKFQNVAPSARNAGNLDKTDQYLTTFARSLEAARLLPHSGNGRGFTLKKTDNRFLNITECMKQEKTWLKAMDEVLDSSKLKDKQMGR